MTARAYARLRPIHSLTPTTARLRCGFYASGCVTGAVETGGGYEMLRNCDSGVATDSRRKLTDDISLRLPSLDHDTDSRNTSRKSKRTAADGRISQVPSRPMNDEDGDFYVHPLASYPPLAVSQSRRVRISTLLKKFDRNKLYTLAFL